MEGRALGPHNVFIFLRVLSFLTSVPGGGLASTEVSRLMLCSTCLSVFSQQEEKGRDLSKLGGWNRVCRTSWVGLSGLRSEVKGKFPDKRLYSVAWVVFKQSLLPGAEDRCGFDSVWWRDQQGLLSDACDFPLPFLRTQWFWLLPLLFMSAWCMGLFRESLSAFKISCSFAGNCQPWRHSKCSLTCTNHFDK